MVIFAAVWTYTKSSALKWHQNILRPDQDYLSILNANGSRGALLCEDVQILLEHATPGPGFEPGNPFGNKVSNLTP